MKTTNFPLFLAVFCLLTVLAPAATLYVDVNSTNPTPPYADWTTAAADIQSAVDVSSDGDQIWVNDGVYQAGGEPVSGVGATTNRVVINKAVTVQSVNGAAATTISGNKVPYSNPNSVRCVFLTNGAALIGFTLTNGSTRYGEPGGGVYCASTNTIISGCVLTGNTAGIGGGAESGTLTNCVIINNAANDGGLYWGGGTADANLYNCSVISNSASAQGGGVCNGTLNNCILTGNSSGMFGGGAFGSVLNNCSLSGNTGVNGGAGYGCTLNNCTLTGNGADFGGGAGVSTLNNCIIYGNQALPQNQNLATGSTNYYNCTLNYCCTTPLPTAGSNNITADPQLADSAHVSPNSPCIGTGSPVYSSGVDIDNEPWAGTPSIGCDEYYPGTITGALAVAQTASYLQLIFFSTGAFEGSESIALTPYYVSVPTNFVLNFTAQISGRANSNLWSFGDGTFATNEVFLSHGWNAAGDYPVAVTVFNESFPNGVTSAITVHVAPVVTLYVSLTSTNPVPPYTSWATAATNIQNAVDAAFTVPNTMVLVSDGVYNSGFSRAVSGTSTTNRLTINKPLTVQSLNGPAVTTIQGYLVPGTFYGANALRCVYLIKGASLIGFTLTNGATIISENGGGVWCSSSSAFVSNCIIAGNYASLSGGGAYSGTLNNCMLSGNVALNRGNGGGGGACLSALNNCTIFSNTVSLAGNGGGTLQATLNNCSIVGNSAGSGGGTSDSTLTNCILGWNLASASGGGAYRSNPGVNASLNTCSIIGNSAKNSGGGASGCPLINCTLLSNNAVSGGGSYNGSLYNCTVCNNYATNSGGGIYSASSYNCIVYYNLAPSGSNYISGSMNYSCTMPKPSIGTANFTNASLFVDLAGGNFRLQSNSPCINAGNNIYATGTNDLDGNPRIVGGAVDIGAYEYQTPSSLLSYAWAQQYGLPTDGSADYADTDDTGMNNWQKWIAGLNPTNSASVLAMLPPPATNHDAGVTVSWQSVNTRTYYLQRATDLTAQPAFSAVQSNLVGQAGVTSFTDTSATNGGPYFYRVGVQ